MASDYVLLSLTLGGVIPRDLDEGSGKHPADYDTYQTVFPNDLVMCLFDYDVTPRTVGHVTQKGIVTGAYTRLIPKSTAYSKYYYYYFLWLDGRKELLHLCTGLRNVVSKHVFWSLLNPQPSLETQKRIADFLDEKTKIIDELIAKKEQLTEFLREKRTALITRAVTKGLDSHAKLKPSGVEWLGDIPEGWKVTKLRRGVSFRSGHGFPEEIQGQDEGEFPFLKVSDINGEQIHISSARNYVSEFNIKSRGWKKIPAGSVLTAKIGAALAVNHRKINDVECIIDNNMLAFILCKKSWLHPKYFFMISKSFDLNWFVNPGAVPSVNLFQLKELIIPVPEKENQKRIADFLDTKTERIDKAVALIESQIEKLKQYRSSLIYSTVTGKIKI